MGQEIWAHTYPRALFFPFFFLLFFKLDAFLKNSLPQTEVVSILWRIIFYDIHILKVKEQVWEEIQGQCIRYEYFIVDISRSYSMIC